MLRNPSDVYVLYQARRILYVVRTVQGRSVESYGRTRSIMPIHLYSQPDRGPWSAWVYNVLAGGSWSGCKYMYRLIDAARACTYGAPYVKIFQ